MMGSIPVAATAASAAAASASRAAPRIPRLALYAPLRSSVLRTCRRGDVFSTPTFLLSFTDALQQRNQHYGNGSRLFSGMEATLADLGTDAIQQKESAELIRESGLELLLNIDVYTDQKDSYLSSPSNIARDLVKSFESQLHTVSDLGDGIAHINCRGFGASHKDGTDLFGNPRSVHSEGNLPWDEETILEFLLDALPLSAQFLEDHPDIGKGGNETDVMGGAPHHLTGISHETLATSPSADSGGGDRLFGMMHHPSSVRYLLEVVPPLRLTMNLSSWHDVCGHSWGTRCDGDSGVDEEAEALSVEIVPHIDLIRTRTSLFSGPDHFFTQTKQNPNHLVSKKIKDDNNTKCPMHNDNYLRTHQSLWEEVWTRKTNRGVERLFMTLEDDIDGTPYKDGNENEFTRRIDRLSDSASRIHQYYDRFSIDEASPTQ